MRTKNKPTVGQRMFSLNVGNAARHTPQALTPVTVTKVGRKYFSVRRDGFSWDSEYKLSDWFEKSDYTASSVIYANEQEWEDEKEEEALLNALSDAFSCGVNRNGVPLESLRKMVGMIPPKSKA